MITTFTTWIALLYFPVLMSAPVTAPIIGINQEHCIKVRKLLESQLKEHRSNATLSECFLATVIITPLEVKRDN
jgi:hypothetical protein